MFGCAGGRLPNNEYNCGPFFKTLNSYMEVVWSLPCQVKVVCGNQFNFESLSLFNTMRYSVKGETRTIRTLLGTGSTDAFRPSLFKLSDQPALLNEVLPAHRRKACLQASAHGGSSCSQQCYHPVYQISAAT